MLLYLRNQRSKQTNLASLQFLFELCTILPKLVQKVVKKRTSNMKVYYIIPLSYQLTGHLENFKIKLCYFEEKLSLQYNIILKLLSPFQICF